LRRARNSRLHNRRLRHAKFRKFRERLPVFHPLSPPKIRREVLSRIQAALYFFDVERPKVLTGTIDPDLHLDPGF
jgi:hypothetical protein